ncbi:MAG: hypothetical protein JM58_08170 [Peptococcaceae bacterium BICA1-8]|nr:MAG: hypothetical protein JM58_08170 [Peptococcaceae bacterium BICA1-8]
MSYHVPSINIIDGHVYLGHSINDYALKTEQLLASLEELKINGAVVCPVQPKDYHLKPANDLVVKAVSDFPKKLVGFCRVDPRQGEKALTELIRCRQLGLKGLLLHPWEEGYRINSEKAVQVVSKAAEMNMPILVESGYPWVSHALQVADLCGLVPNAVIMMSHGGQINISGLAQADAFAALRSHSNLYIQTSGVYRQDFLEEVIIELGSERVIFGSTFPIMDQEYELKRVLNLNITYKEKTKLLGENLLKLINSEVI